MNRRSSLKPSADSSGNYDPAGLKRGSASSVEGSRTSLTGERKRVRIPTESKLQPSRSSRSYNLMGVLPVAFTAWAQGEFDLPIISETPLYDIYPILAEVLDCPDYIVNPSTFWYLDTIAAALNKAQKDTSMTLAEQKQMIAWFGHIMNIFREKRWSREEILCNVNADIMVIGYNLDNFSWVAPAPQPARSYLMTATTSRSFTQVDVPKGWTYLPYIFHLIFDVFANPFQFHVIKNSLFQEPVVTDVKMPHSLRFPKAYKSETLPLGRSIKSPERITMLLSQETREKGPEKKPTYILPLKEAVNHEFIRNIFATKPISQET